MNKSPFLIIFIFYCLSEFCFGKIYHGAGMQMTWDGAGIYYKRFCSLDNNIQLNGDIGLHFEKSQYRLNGDRFYNYQTIFLDLTAGYYYSLFSYQYTKPFRLNLIFDLGGMADLESFKNEDFAGIWIIKYMLGLGAQFYNASILNEITLKFAHSEAIESPIVFMVSFYWN